MSESPNYSVSELSSAYGAPDLEFPDWSGQVSRHGRVGRDEWLAYCRSKLPQLRARPGYNDTRLQDGIAAEFIL